MEVSFDWIGFVLPFSLFFVVVVVGVLVLGFVCLVLTIISAISLALVCSFSRMRILLGLGAVRQEEIREETLSAVAEALKKSTFVKVSEDGMV